MRLAKAPSYCAITNPTVNSFKRPLGLEEDKLLQNKPEGPDMTRHIFESLRNEYRPQRIGQKTRGLMEPLREFAGIGREAPAERNTKERKEYERRAVLVEYGS